MTAARRASTGAAHGARSHHNRTPACSPPPDYRIAARSVKDAWRRRLRRPGSARSLTRPARSPGSAAAGEQGRPRPQAAQQARGPVRHALERPKHGQKTCKTPLDTAPLLQG